MPASIWSRVPKNTRSSDSTNSTTVSCKEASPLSTRRGVQRRGAGAGAGGLPSGAVRVTGDGAGAVVTEVSLIGGSGELHGLHELLERGGLFGHQVVVAQHLEV